MRGIVDAFKDDDDVKERGAVVRWFGFEQLQQPFERILLMCVGIGDSLFDVREQLTHGGVCIDATTQRQHLIERRDLCVLLVDGRADDHVFAAGVAREADLQGGDERGEDERIVVAADLTQLGRRLEGAVEFDEARALGEDGRG